jgi:hypothetical protein
MNRSAQQTAPADREPRELPSPAHVRAIAHRLQSDLAAATHPHSPLAPHEILDIVTAAMDACLARLEETGCWGRANQLLSSELWNIAGQSLALGSLQVHARTKPAGYPGDYRMLYRLCTRDCQGTGLARAFDEYFQNHAAPQAVRNRAEVIASAFLEVARDGSREKVQVISYGSGPAYELYCGLQVLGEAHRRRVRILLLDIDPHALDFAAAQLQPALPAEHITCRRVNLRRFPRHARPGELAVGDFIFCAGFLDYLNDDEACALLSLLWNRLAERGRLLVFNFSEPNPSRAYMEWFGNWYLNHRTEAQLGQLAEVAGVPARRREVGREPAGINLFLRAGK